jgi:hypothetical protein
MANYFAGRAAFTTASDFGVQGDGTDESVGLQRALDQAASLGESFVYLHPGRYKASGLNMNGLVFVGDGASFVGGNYSVGGSLNQIGSLLGNTDRIFNPKAYGAVVDGVTSDQTAVNNAVTAAQNAGGGIVWISPNCIWSPNATSVPSSVTILDFSQTTAVDPVSLRIYGQNGQLLEINGSAERAGGIRREMGAPAQGGRVYVNDQLWVEDDLWADEGIQVTTAPTIESTTLSIAANAGDKTITLTSVPASFATDMSLHIKDTVTGHIDRPRVMSILGNVITLDAGLRYSYAVGQTVYNNIWRGAIFPITTWDNPGGYLNIGATQTAQESASNPQYVAMNKNHVVYQTLLSGLFGDWIISGGNLTATSGYNITVNGSVFMRGANQCVSTTQTVTIPTPDPINPRIDIVVLSSTGVASVIVGTPAPSPVAPTASSSQTLLGQVSVSAGAVSIVQGNISDKRRKYTEFLSLDPSNGGWRFRYDDTNYVSIRSTASMKLIQAVTNGNNSDLSLNPSGGKVLLGGALGVGNSATASTLGTVAKKMQVYDANGNSLGFIPIYDSIT